MILRLALVPALLACLPAVATAGLEPAPFPLALVRVSGGPSSGAPDLMLAQRAIERQWPMAGDSGVVVIPDGRSELGAAMLSAVLPGAGQAYVGSPRGLFFAAIEASCWLALLLLRDDADDLRGEARSLAGAPADSASAWSFERYEDATQQGTDYLRALFAADPDAFDEAIGSDDRYAAGWTGVEARNEFADLRQSSDDKLSWSHAAEGALWLNHLVAAFDALRAARLHNLPLRQGLELKADARWRRGSPELVLAVERRF